MAENQKTAFNPSDVANVAKKGFDEITGFLEGIAQTVNDLLKDKSLIEVLILMAGGTLSVSAFINELGKLVKDAPDKNSQLARQMILDHHLKIAEDYVSRAGNAIADKTQAAAKAIREDIKKMFLYLAGQDEEWAEVVKKNTTEVHAEAALLRRRRKAMSLFSPVSWFGKRLQWSPRWYRLFAIEEVR